MAESRRVKMTKRLIREAFLELLQMNPAGKITITEVCEAADVNRSTFYAYYESVYDLLKEIENDVLQRIPKPEKDFTPETQKEFIDLLVPFFEYIKKHGKTFSVLISSSNDSGFNSRLAQMLFEAMLNRDIINHSFYAKLGYVFSINGAIGMLKEWIDNDFPISSERFAKIAFEMSHKTNEVAYIQLNK